MGVVGAKKWTVEQIATLNELRPTGMTAAAMGEIIGKSKNSVIGMAGRLGVPLQKTKTGRPVNVGIKKPPKPRAPKVLLIETPRGEPKAPYVQKAAPEEVKARMVPLEQLGPNECRFPFGDGPFLFCGAPGSNPYCAVHTQFTQQPQSALVARNKQAAKAVKEAA